MQNNRLENNGTFFFLQFVQVEQSAPLCVDFSKRGDISTFFVTSVGLSSLLAVFVHARPCVDCQHVIVCVLCECPQMTE